MEPKRSSLFGSGGTGVWLCFFLVLFILGGVFSVRAWGDVIYEEEVTTGGAPEAKLQKRLVVHIKGPWRKEETFIPKAGQLAIYRLNKDWLWVGDKGTKTSAEGSWDEMAGRLLLDRPQTALEIKATGEKKEIMGYPAEKFLIKEEGAGAPVRLEVYVTFDFPGTEEVNESNGMLWRRMGLISEYKASWRGKIKGFPLLIIKKEAGPSGQERITTTKVTNLLEVLLDTREFEAPLVFK